VILYIIVYKALTTAYSLKPLIQGRIDFISLKNSPRYKAVKFSNFGLWSFRGANIQNLNILNSMDTLNKILTQRYIVADRKVVRNEDFQGIVIFCKPFTHVNGWEIFR